MFFANRCDAGRRLAALLTAYRARDPVVLGLPRGGVPVAFEVAHALGATLDLLPVRKLGAPGQPELAIGAVAPGVVVLDREIITLLGVPDDYVTGVRERETAALADRLHRMRGDRPFPDLHERTVIVVDDGIATGSTALAAVDAVRARGAAHVAVATPVCSPQAAAKLGEQADALVYVEAPADFQAVGYWYQDFTPTSDDEVRRLLARGWHEHDAHFQPPADA
jgi:putative phosphoribosyl transferase